MSYYEKNYLRLFNQYMAIEAESVHGCWLSLLPARPGRACDLGAGAGRDTNWLASLGWRVLAVEPCARLRELASENKTEAVEWLDDCLPHLSAVVCRQEQFDLLLLSAVWMHLNEADREIAISVIAKLLKPQGLLVISLRFGPDDGRNFYGVSFEELNASASDHGLKCIFEQPHKDAFGRSAITWHTACFTPSV